MKRKFFDFDISVDIPFEDIRIEGSCYVHTVEERERIFDILRENGVEYRDYPDDVEIDCYPLVLHRQDDRHQYYRVDHAALQKFPLKYLKWMWVSLNT